MKIRATHIRSGHVGEVQDEKKDPLRGWTLFYFEDHARPTVAGWYLSHELEIPGVNR